MNINLHFRLKTLQDFQKKHPLSHVGGSVSLYLRGINLDRDLSNTDLDIVIPYDLSENEQKEYECRSDGNDFDYAVKVNCNEGNYVKIDIRVCPEPNFDVVYFEGFKYNVSLLKDVIHWKRTYAKKGVTKHINDLALITGEYKKVIEPKIDLEDDLPF